MATATWERMQVAGSLPALDVRVLRWFFVGYPLLWVLGLDGFAWLVLPVAWIVATLLSPQRRRFDSPELFALFLFVLTAFITTFFLNEASRLLTWFHDFATIIVIMLIINSVRLLDPATRWRYVELPLAFFVFFGILLAILSFTIPGFISFQTPAYYLLPAGIRDTAFAQALVVKQTSALTWFGGHSFHRISSTGAFSTSYAVMLASWIVYSWSYLRRRGPARWIGWLGLLAIPILLATTDRTSVTALGLAAVLFLWLAGGDRRRIFAIALLIVLVATMVAANFSFSGSAHQLATLRGGGSFVTRLQIYTETWQAFLGWPWGHGSEQTVAGLAYPLGSHSTWLGVAFKFGVAGLVAFVMYIAWLLRKGISVTRGNYRQRALILSLMLAILACSFLEEIYLDSVTALVIASVFGIFLSPFHARTDESR